MTPLGRLTRESFVGKDSRMCELAHVNYFLYPLRVALPVEVLDIRVGKPLLPTKLIPGLELKDCSHPVTKVGLMFTTEAWIINTIT
jgi:hypothetical protein